MNAIHEPLNLGDLVKYEEDCLSFSRDVVTVAAGQNLSLGCIVGKDAATGKVKQIDPGAVDGTQIPVGILMANVNATLVDHDDVLLLARHAVVASKAVVWPVEISPTDVLSLTKQLASIGILIRQAA